MRFPNRVLYYPHYAPNKKKLRALLLFFDTLDLIVPYEDQFGVERRPHVEEMLKLDFNMIHFSNPASANVSQVLEMSEEIVLSKLVEKLLLRKDTITLDHTSKMPAGYLDNQDEITRLLRNNWRTVAVPKMPNRILELAISANLGAHLGVYKDPNTKEIKEQQAFLMHPHLADYVLSRLARGISEQENISTITFDDFSYLGSLHHENTHYTAANTLLASLCTPIIIPDRIEDFSPSDFRDLRQAYSDIRAQAWRIFHGFSIDYGLDKAATLEGVRSAVNDVTA
ncbi:MAG TPA: hypothetical protein PLV61_10985, partial [Parvularculaceae bacterium]|nr:hypothetical protein [Parvularculaceae bacterium]